MGTPHRQVVKSIYALCLCTKKWSEWKLVFVQIIFCERTTSTDVVLVNSIITKLHLVLFCRSKMQPCSNWGTDDGCGGLPRPMQAHDGHWKLGPWEMNWFWAPGWYLMVKSQVYRMEQPDKQLLQQRDKNSWLVWPPTFKKLRWTQEDVLRELFLR